MSSSFDSETLDLLDETDLVYIETRRDGDSPVHRTIIWVVVVEGEAFVRSVRGPKGRWYREISSNPEGALHVRGATVPRARHSRYGRDGGGRGKRCPQEQVRESPRRAYRSRWYRPDVLADDPQTLASIRTLYA